MANLASVILEGSTMMESSVDTSNYDFSDSVVEESSYTDMAVATLFTNIMEADQNYMVADVIAAATILHENSIGNNVDGVAVAESVNKNGIGKLKAAFQKFIAKIKEYYKRVINWFKAMFSNAEDFVKNYGNIIKSKAAKVKDFQYTGWEYDLTSGDKLAETYAADAKAKLQDLVGGFDFVKDVKSKSELGELLRSKKLVSAEFAEDKVPTAAEEVEKYLKGKNIDDIADMKEKIIDKYHKGNSKKTDIKNFEANSVDEMLNFLKGAKKQIAKWQTQLANYEKATNDVIKKLNALESGKDEEGGSNIVSNASYLAGLVSAFLNVYKAPCEVQITINKAASTEFLAILKKFYNYKGNKGAKFESVVFDEEAYATLESELILESDDVEDIEEGCGKKKVCEGDDESDMPEVDEPATESMIGSILDQAARFTF